MKQYLQAPMLLVAGALALLLAPRVFGTRDAAPARGGLGLGMHSGVTTLTPGSTQTVFTVPGTGVQRVILKDVWVVDGTNLLYSGVTLYLGDNDGATVTHFATLDGVPMSTAWQNNIAFSGGWVFDPGDSFEVEVTAGTAGSFDIGWTLLVE